MLRADWAIASTLPAKPTKRETGSLAPNLQGTRTQLTEDGAVLTAPRRRIAALGGKTALALLLRNHKMHNTSVTSINNPCQNTHTHACKENNAFDCFSKLLRLFLFASKLLRPLVQKQIIPPRAIESRNAHATRA